MFAFASPVLQGAELNKAQRMQATVSLVLVQLSRGDLDGWALFARFRSSHVHCWR